MSFIILFRRINILYLFYRFLQNNFEKIAFYWIYDFFDYNCLWIKTNKALDLLTSAHTKLWPLLPILHLLLEFGMSQIYGILLYEIKSFLHIKDGKELLLIVYPQCGKLLPLTYLNDWFYDQFHSSFT